MYFTMLKRDARLFLRSLLPAVALTLVFALVCVAAALSVTSSAEEVFTPVKAAVVDEEDTVTSRMLVNLVKGTEYISDALTVERMNMEKAMAALHSGEIAVVIVLPENFVGDILSGVSSRGQIILSPAAVSNADVVKTTARFGEIMLAAGQYAAISGDALLLEYEIGSTFRNTFLTDTNAALLDEAMGAPQMYFDVQVTRYADTSMSVWGHYAVSFIVFLLFVSAGFFKRLCCTDTSRSLLCRLRASGVSDGAFLLGKYLYPFLFRTVFILMILPLLGDMVCFCPSAVLSAIVGLLVVSVIGTSVMLSLQSGVAANMLLAVAGLFLCGGLLPRQMLPEKLLFLGDITPFGAVRNLVSPLFGGKISLLTAVFAVIYLLAAVFLSFHALRSKRVGGDMS